MKNYEVEWEALLELPRIYAFVFFSIYLFKTIKIATELSLNKHIL